MSDRIRAREESNGDTERASTRPRQDSFGFAPTNHQPVPWSEIQLQMASKRRYGFTRVPKHVHELNQLSNEARMQSVSRGNGLEQVVADSPLFDPSNLFIKRVTACLGWAIHGLIFEYWSGKRQGVLLVDFGEQHNMHLRDDDIEKRSGVGWTDINKGDYIVGVHGHHLQREGQKWLCYSITIEFASGQSVHYEATHRQWKGKAYSYKVPQNCLVYRIAFKKDQQEDMLGVVTSLHLPLSRANRKHLPRLYREAVKSILAVDSTLASMGEKPLGEDVWWYILGFIRGWELELSPASVRVVQQIEDRRPGYAM